MSDINYPLAADGGPDDLPRTLRRERDAREREARERLAKEQQRESFAPHASASASGASHDPFAADTGYPNAQAEPLPATVRRFDVPFVHMVGFFLKAVFAMVPALILLGAILWGIGQLLQTFFPQLVKMQILIWFPN